MSIDNKDLFISEKLTENLIRIEDVSSTIMYLLIGDEKACLIDTGYGCGDLLGYVRKFTEKPIIVLITHGHRDHAMGTAAFEDVYMSYLDKEKYAEDSPLSIRKESISKVPSRKVNNGLWQYIEDSDWHEAKPFEEIKPLNPGDVFDLGNLTVEVHEGAGHSEGNITLLFVELKMLMLGDAVNCNTRIWNSVNEYKEMLMRLNEKTIGRYNRVLYQHEGGEGPIDTIKGVLELCDEIINGTDDKIPFVGNNLAVFAGRDMRLAKKQAPENGPLAREDGGIGNLIYDIDLVVK